MNHQQIKLKLSSIQKIHPIIKNNKSVVNLEYILSDIDLVSSSSLDTLLLIHPIFVIKSPESTYNCIAGFRTFQIARHILETNNVINVTEIYDITDSDITYIANLDIYLSHLLYSLRTSDTDIQLTSLYQNTDNNIRKQLTPGLNKNKFAEAINTNRVNFSRKRTKK